MDVMATLILSIGFYIGCDAIADGIKDLARSIRENRR
jgi:hypothetical protein